MTHRTAVRVVGLVAVFSGVVRAAGDGSRLRVASLSILPAKWDKAANAAKVGMMICVDRPLPEPARALSLGRADVILCPAYGGWGDWNTRIMQVRAYENEVYVVFTHRRTV